MSNLKEKWLSMSKREKVNLISGIILWIVAITYVVIMSLAPTIWPNKAIATSLALSVPMTGGFDDVWPRILGSIYYICLSMGIANALNLILRLPKNVSPKTKTMLSLLASFARYAGLIVAVLLVIAVWGVNSTALLVSAGIIALIIGLGAQSLISDIIAGLNIVFESEFKVGDIVVIDDYRGTVQEIGLTTTKLVDLSGNVKTINNSHITTVVNLSENPSVAAAVVTIDYNENLPNVEKLIREHLSELKSNIPQMVGEPEYLGVSALSASSVDLKVICHCQEVDRFDVERALNRELYLLFVNNGVDIPFNQLSLSYRDPSEKKENKKPAAKPAQNSDK